MRLAAAAAAAGAMAVAVGPPAAAVDDAKPTPCGGQMFLADKAGDQTPPTGFADSATGTTDLLGIFAKHEPAKGAEAATFNFHVKDLQLAVPGGFSSVTWQTIYRMPDDSQKWVRAVLDFSGSLVFEYGDLQAAPEDLTNVSVYRGQTQGKAFEGPDGVMQVVIPADRGGAPGTTISDVVAEARLGRTVPNSAQTPTRGLANTLDQAPDVGAETAVSITQTPCAAAASDPPPPAQEPSATPPQPPAEASPKPASGPSPLALTLLTRRATAKKVKKALVLKVRTQEPVTSLAAQIRKGSATLGSGRLRSLRGTGAIRLRLSKRLKKGSYVVDFAGTDSEGRRRMAAFKLKVG